MSSADCFEILYNDVAIGSTSFELGDPPMGVAFGKFTPTPAYLRNDVVDNNLLSARVAGRVVPSVGLGIEHEDSGSGGIEVTILGVPDAWYEELFPQHVKAYEAILDRTDLAKSDLSAPPRRRYQILMHLRAILRSIWLSGSPRDRNER